MQPMETTQIQHLMRPEIKNIKNEHETYYFTLSNINVSVANAIRRTILTEIPIVCFITEHEAENTCIFHENTSRLHNEILKQRLSCIPVIEKSLEKLPNKYMLEVDVENTTDNILYVTTEDFKIRNKTTNEYLSQTDTRRLFPADPLTNSFIDFVRLRPKVSDMIPGEKIKFECEFSVSNAKKSSCYNVVSKCAYQYTPHLEKIRSVWEEQQNKLLAEDIPKTEIDFQKRNFMILDSQRHYIENSFDFVIQSIGIYSNIEIVKKACAILQNKFMDMYQLLDADSVPIHISETTVEHSYDIELENEDYTIGKLLEYILYEIYYIKDKTLTFCGFRKMHPHDESSIIRIAFVDRTDKEMVRKILSQACLTASELMISIHSMF